MGLKVACYCRFQVTFQRTVPKFVAILPITFPSSEIGCELRKKMLTSTFQCFNYCKQMSIVQVEINNSMESFWSSGARATKKVCVSLNWLLLLSMNICLQMKFITLKRTCELCCEVRAQYLNLET
jgi:hypothetical protein